jgi:hypothetical protein
MVRKLSYQLNDAAQTITSASDNIVIPATPPCLFLVALIDCIMLLGACSDCHALVLCIEESGTFGCWELWGDAEDAPDGRSSGPIVTEGCWGLRAGSLFVHNRAAISLSLAACNITDESSLRTTPIDDIPSL